ncbi:MAG: hypothetical protein Q4F02_00255 [Candidatus Saccharibacteria bacterium]|nr:hypothetical protein [Candidatus Saccharibacteria bacterium]
MELLRIMAADAEAWIIYESVSGGLLQPVKFFVEPPLAVKLPGYGKLDIIASAFVLTLLLLLFTLGIRLCASASMWKRLSAVACVSLGVAFLACLCIHNYKLFEVKVGILVAALLCAVLGVVWAVMHYRAAKRALGAKL